MSITIEKEVLLAPYTTLGIGGPGEYFMAVHTRDELVHALTYARENALAVTVLGGGSNMLIPDSGVRGLVIHMMIEGTTYQEDGEYTLVTAGAGMNFDACIDEVIAHELWGLENLTAIPGTVGGTPIQNVGAYGVEVGDVITGVDVFDCDQDRFITLTRTECAFGYRDSLFKREGKGRYIIVGVTFKLSRVPHPQTQYRDLALRFKENTAPSLREIQTAVREIRSTKFPDWTHIGTAGSFFKNPFVDASVAQELRTRYPELPLYESDDGRYKVALGWILDRVLNLKGFREGHVGLYEKQALVLVNFGGATSDEVYTFSDAIIKKIFDATGIVVEREVIVMNEK